MTKIPNRSDSEEEKFVRLLVGEVPSRVGGLRPRSEVRRASWWKQQQRPRQQRARVGLQRGRPRDLTPSLSPQPPSGCRPPALSHQQPQTGPPTRGHSGAPADPQVALCPPNSTHLAWVPRRPSCWLTDQGPWVSVCRGLLFLPHPLRHGPPWTKPQAGRSGCLPERRLGSSLCLWGGAPGADGEEEHAGPASPARPCPRH